jgi:hypothetical protein
MDFIEGPRAHKMNRKCTLSKPELFKKLGKGARGSISAMILDSEKVLPSVGPEVHKRRLPVRLRVSHPLNLDLDKTLFALSNKL